MNKQIKMVGKIKVPPFPFACIIYIFLDDFLNIERFRDGFVEVSKLPRQANHLQPFVSHS